MPGAEPHALAASDGSERTFEVEAIAFDLDGTLLDTIGDLTAAVNALLRDSGWHALPAGIVRNLVGKGMRNLVSRAVALSRGRPPDEAELEPLLARYRSFYAAQLGRETTPFPGVRAALGELRARGFRLAVVTNKASVFVQPHLERAGIGECFDVVIGGEDAAAKKPDPAPLLLAAQRLSIAPQRLLMVGDSVNDVDAARAAGCPVLVVPYGYNEGVAVEALASDGIVETLEAIPGRVFRN